MRRFIIIVAIVIIVACVGIPIVLSLSGARLGPGAAGAGGQAIAQKAVVDKGDITLTVSATGSIVARQQSSLSFVQPGRVVEVLVEEGQKVQAGQLLARLDDTTQQSNLDQANAGLQAAQAALDKVLAPVQKSDIDIAEAAVKSAEAAYSAAASSGASAAKRNAYQLQVDQANAALDAAEKNRMAMGRYGTDDPIYQKSLAQVGQASFNLESSRLRLQQASRGSLLVQEMANVAQAQARLAQVKAGPTQNDINMAQAQVKNAQIARDQAQHALDKTKLVAPYAGTVTTVNVKQNEMSTGAAIVLTDISELDVDIAVDETDIGQISVGQHIDLTLDALPGTTLGGTVQRIAELADESASVITYNVHIKLEPTTAPIKMSMTANAVFLVREVKDVLRVPNQYLRTNTATKQTTVLIVNADNSLTEVPVKLGLQGSDYSEIIQGLNEGEAVALSASAPAPAAS
jgi:HlyD family secretion protein